jgi:gas vesicle protein GvpO
VADDEETTPRRRRRARTDDSDPEQEKQAARDEGGEQEPDEQEPAADADARRDDGDQDESAVPAAAAARRAAQHVADFTGRRPENVISIERRDGDWQVGVEVVETHRIPDTTDVLAIYEVRLDPGGRLLSYRRTRRYARGQLDKECR